MSVFHARGYPQETTQDAFDRVQLLDRESVLQPSEPTSSERVPLVLTYHPLNVPIRNIIFRNFRMLLHDKDSSQVFKQLPVTAFRKDKNIANHLVRASQPTPPGDAPGTFRCNRKVCHTCPYVSDETHISAPSGTFNIRSRFTCTSQNIIYIIRCTNCNKLYIGESKRRLGDRIVEHLRSVKNNSVGFPVAHHFNPPSSCNLSHFSVCGALYATGNDRDRLVAEHRLIFQLGTLQPKGLNNTFCTFKV